MYVYSQKCIIFAMLLDVLCIYIGLEKIVITI